jgi:energy-coupling factor transporter ATP-binding protein EcfA2
LLDLRGVSYRYAGSARPALDGVELAVERGEVVGLTGPNGSGKSTLCLVTAGLAPGSIGGELSGEVRVDGEPVGRRSETATARVGIVFSNPAAQRTGVAATVFEEVAFGAVNLGLPVVETVARTRDALAALGIEDLAERHPARLSGGQAQLVAIASMLAMRSSFLVLDEPVAELDGAGRALVGEAIRQLARDGHGVLITEHDLELLSDLCSRVVTLRDGRIESESAPASPEEAPPRLPALPSSGDIAVRCTGVAYSYPDGTSTLDGIDLEIRTGERVAIVGRNGSGKTTLARTWNGLVRASHGSVAIGGKPTTEQHVAGLARQVGLVFQDPDDQLFARTCRDEVSFGARNVGKAGAELGQAVDRALDAVGLRDEAATNPYDLGPSRRRLLALACVLAMQTPVVVLDEPTMGLDIAERARVQSIVAALAAEGRTVVAISHDARFVTESFGRAIRLDAGRVVDDGPPAEVLAGWAGEGTKADR